MTECVVIVRLQTGDELIAIIVGEKEGKVQVEHPYYIKHNPIAETVGMFPYCALSDEIFYEIDRSKIDFVVTSNEDIADKFIKMINTLQQPKNQPSIEESSQDSSTVSMTNTTFVQGNDTKH